MADSAYLKAFRDYIREEPSNNDLPTMEQEFYGESDRAVALLQGAALGISLQAAILKKMRTNLTTEDEKKLFEGNGPISTFSARILIGFALNAFGKKTRHDLDLIRELRNAFAHVRKPMKFDTPQVSDMCSGLFIPDMNGLAMHPKSFAGGEPNLSDMNNPRSRYLTACHTIAFNLFHSRILP